MALEIVFQHRALKELKHIPKTIDLAYWTGLRPMRATPDNPGHAVPALVGAEPTRRLKVGDWRVLFDRLAIE